MLIESHDKKYSVIKKVFSSKKNTIYICKEKNSVGQELFTVNVIKDDKLISKYIPHFITLKDSSNSDLMDLFSKDSVLYIVFKYYPQKLYFPLQYNDCTSMREKIDLSKKLLLYLQSSEIPLEILIMVLEGNSMLIDSSCNFHMNYFIKFDTSHQEPKISDIIQIAGKMLEENLFNNKSRTHPQLSEILSKCESGQYLTFEEVYNDWDEFQKHLNMNPEEKSDLPKRKKKSLKNYLRIRNTYILKKFAALSAVLLLLVCFISYAFILPFVLNKFYYHEFYVNTKPLASFSGKAKVLYGDSKLLYEGQILEGKYNGFGMLYNKRHELVYSGDFKLNNYNGNGELFKNNKTKYKGDFLLNKYNGKGQLYYDNEVLFYEGDFKDGVFDGSGTLYYPDGKTKYQGEFKKGIFSGSGTLYSENKKIRYKGDFKFGKYESQGILYDSTGNKKYTGSFSDGLLEGEGTEYSSSGAVIYKGTFGQGLYNGQGILFDAEKNSPIYEGSFIHGKYNGTGKLYDTKVESLVYEGEFKNNEFHGTGTLYGKSSRKLYTGSFIHGNPDYFPVLGIPAEEIKNIFPSIPQTSTGVDCICNTYEELGVTLVLTPVPAEPTASDVPEAAPATKSADATATPSPTKDTPVVTAPEPKSTDSTPPSVSKVLLWKDFSVSGVSNNMNVEQMTKILGDPLYSYSSPLLSEDQIAITNRQQSGFGPGKIPARIYMVSFDTDGYELTAAFLNKKSTPVYAVLSKKSIVYGMG